MRKVTTMRNTLSRGLALSAAIALAPTLIHAQSANNCGPRASVVETLGQKYGESRQGMGLDDRGAMLEIFAFAIFGLWALGAAVEGYWENRLSLLPRLAVGVVGAALLWPLPLAAHLGALAAFAAFFAWNIRAGRGAQVSGSA